MKVSKYLILLLVASALLSGVTEYFVSAESGSLWRRSDLEITEISSHPRQKRFSAKNTTNKLAVSVMNPEGHLVNGAMFQGRDVEWLSDGQTTYVRYGNEEYFHELAIDNNAEYTLIDQTNILLIKRAFAWTDLATGPVYFSVIDLTTDSVEPVSHNVNNVVTKYSLRSEKEKQLLPAVGMVDSNHIPSRYVLSNNGKYMLAWVDNASLIKVELGTQKSWVVSQKIDNKSLRPGAISNDGRYVVVENNATLIDTDSCGDVFDRSSIGGVGYFGVEHPCRSYSFEALVEDKIGEYEAEGDFVLKDNNALEYTTQKDISSPLRSVRVNNIQTALNKKLKYLAMGDSYSSGEGDIGRRPDGQTYYLAGTAGKGLCHISERAYPFVLASKWNINTQAVESVACSGALVRRDFSADTNLYMGQHGELAGLSSPQRRERIEVSKGGFLPGIVPQIEFLKEYQPEVVTITGGGNDVGFKNILEYCVKDIVKSTVYSCEYVKGGVLHDVLNDSIDSRYSDIKDLIRKIKTISPGTRVYYVGYPSFIADGDAQCALNSGFISGREQDMINQAVRRLNFVTKHAVEEAGAQYVDIADVLEGGRLCEGSEYVTGVWDVGLFSGEYDQTFHPNSAGHKKIAEKIYQDVHDPTEDYSPKYIVSEDISPSIRTDSSTVLRSTEIEEGGMIEVHMIPDTLLNSSEALVTIFSRPERLGLYRVTKDGSLSVKTRLPEEIEPGRHLVLVEGIAADGMPVRVYQFMTVLPKKVTNTTPTSMSMDDTGSSLGKGDGRLMSSIKNTDGTPELAAKGTTSNFGDKAVLAQSRIDSRHMLIASVAVILLLCIIVSTQIHEKSKK